jgi:cation:H+ antiporter
MLLNILCALFGFVILYFGSLSLVEGAVRISTRLGLSRAIVGLTFVAFGTSSPELFVNIVAAFKSETGFALTNVAGSNLVNLCVGFGLTALVSPLLVSRSRFRIDLLFFFASPLVILTILMIHPESALPGWTCFILFALMFLYIRSIAGRNQAAGDPDAGDPDAGKQVAGPKKFWVGVLLFILGIGMLYGGGEAVLHASINFSKRLGIPNPVIGLTVVAIGTSIPDIMATVVAARKGEIAIGVGNLIGSNIYNLLFVLGGTLAVSWTDLVAGTWIVRDYGMVCFCSILFVVFVRANERVGKLKGVLFLLLFAAYMAVRIGCL